MVGTTAFICHARCHIVGRPQDKLLDRDEVGVRMIARCFIEMVMGSDIISKVARTIGSVNFR